MFRMQHDLDDLFGRVLGYSETPARYRSETAPAAWWPAIESYAKDGELHVRVALPGVDPKDVEVTVSDDHLTIRGERKSKTEEKDGGRFVREFAYGSFERTLALPDGVDPGRVQARFSNGMLDLTMPAPVAVVPKKVEIQIEGGAEQAKAIKSA
jgi:HSP20 family protein